MFLKAMMRCSARFSDREFVTRMRRGTRVYVSDAEINKDVITVFLPCSCQCGVPSTFYARVDRENVEIIL